MSRDEFVTLATFPDEVSASIVRAQLEEAGVRTYLQGGELGTTLWHVGTAIGGVALQVAAIDAARAVDLLRNEIGAETIFDLPGSLWLCGDCGETVSGRDETCPVCGAERDILGEQPVTRVITEEELTAAALADGEVLGEDDSEGDSRDPDVGAPRPDNSRDDEPRRDWNETAQRAWRAAWIGILFPPLLVYALALVIQVSGRKLDARGRRSMFGAAAVLALAALVIALAIGSVGS